MFLFVLCVCSCWPLLFFCKLCSFIKLCLFFWFQLTHFVMLKELKHCRSVEDLECNDNVKHKARDFIKKYMAKFGTVYQRPKDDD